MIKYLVLALVIIALFAGIFYFVSGGKFSLTPSQSSVSESAPNQQVSKITDTSDESLEGDLTALDKDLAEMESSENTSLSELNAL